MFARLLFAAALAASAMVLVPAPAAAQDRKEDAPAGPFVFVYPGDGGLRRFPGAPEFGDVPDGVTLDGVWFGAERGAYLGVALGEGADKTVTVTRVVPDSPAAKAGLRDGDVILSVDGKAVASPREVTAALKGKKAGDRVAVELRRDGRRETVTATLAERPAPTFFASPGFGAWGFGPQARLGVTLIELTDQLREHFGVEAGRGALVASVEAGSPAAKAGVRAGDVVVSVNGRDVDGARDVIGAMRGLEAGARTVDVVVVRDRSRQTLQVTVEVPEPPRAPESWQFAPGTRFRA